MSPRERFFRYVQITDTCWLWKGGLTHNGYGRYKINYRSVKAHRFSWELHFGKIPENALILHTCDNPKCVNPKHLEIGTQLDNVRDCQLKGRKFCKLKPEQVLEIAEFLRKNTATEHQLAVLYGVSYDSIAAIRDRKAWENLLSLANSGGINPH